MESQDRASRVTHVLDIALQAARGGNGAELAGGVDDDGDGVGINGSDAPNSGDKSSRLVCIADARRVGFGDAWSLIGHVNVVAAVHRVRSRVEANRSVAAA